MVNGETKISGLDKSTTYPETERKETNKRTFLYVTIAILAVVLFFVMFTQFGESHYEKGNAYLKNKQYTEALSEYQKIDPGEKDYPKAQSKIAYINGLTSYNMSMYPAALMYLAKVTPDDEYFHDAQLMMQNINKLTEDERLRTQLDSLSRKKDTVVVRHETATEKGSSTKVEEAISDTELSKRYFTKLERIISNFENQYQAAAVAQVTTKRDYVEKMQGYRRDLINSVYEAKNKDQDLIQLRNDINTWIDKRIAFINKLISENSVSETNTSRSLKEEGDKLYYRVKTQLSKVDSRY